MRKFLLLSVLTILALTASAGYIEKVGDKTVIHVKVFQMPDPANIETSNRAELAVVKAFLKEYPAIFAKKYRDKYKADPATYGKHDWDNVQIQLDRFSGIYVEGVETDLLAIAGGMAPDILYINFRKSDTYIRNNFLYPLDDYFRSLTKEEIDFRINSKLWPVIRRKGSDGKEHIYAMPYGGAIGKVLLYRKDLFDANHIPYPNNQWTWNDLYDACKKITDTEKGTYGLQLARGKHESFYFMTFLWSAGADAMSYNRETDEWRCVFDTKEAAIALEFYNRISNEKWIDQKGRIQRGYSSKDSRDQGNKWTRGEVGMMFSYIDEKMFAKFEPEVTGMIPVPIGFTGKRGGELNSRMMSIFSQVKDPVIRDAAWEYMKFNNGKESEAIRTKIMVEGGLGRFVNPKYLKMFGYPDVVRLCPKGWSEIYDIAIATGQPEPYGKNSNVAYQLLTNPIQEAEALSIGDKLPENYDARVNALQEILKKHCALANEMMIGLITPQERVKRRVCALILIVGIAIAFTFVFRKIIRAFTPPAEDEGVKKGWQFRRYFWAYMLLMPSVLTILVWNYTPLLQGSIMAFFDYRLIGKSAWVGLDNFGDLIFDSVWWQSLWNAFRYSTLVLSMTFLPPIILAILLQEVPRGKLLFRTIYYLPAVITGLVTMLLWKQFYDPSEQGTLNMIMTRIPAVGFILVGALLALLAFMFARRLCFYSLWWPMWGFILVGVALFFACADLANPILFPHHGETWSQTFAALPKRLFGFLPEPYKWLSDPGTSMIACVLPMIWAGMGPGCLIYLAALKGIPEDYYEAADIDGATFIDKILFVVFPTLKALVIINFIGAFIASWYGAAGSILAMTGGGANTETADLHIWYTAFTFLKFGPASAMAWMLGFMMIGFTVHQLRILSKVEFRTVKK